MTAKNKDAYGFGQAVWLSWHDPHDQTSFDQPYYVKTAVKDKQSLWVKFLSWNCLERGNVWPHLEFVLKGMNHDWKAWIVIFL